VINDLVLMSIVGIRVVLVHGGGPDIDAELERFGIKSERVKGLRVTDDDTMKVVQMVLSGKVQQNLVALIQKAGGKAVGLTGIDGGTLKAKKLLVDGTVDIGYVGEIVSVDDSVINTTLDRGYIPVVSTVALGEDDFMPYNVNADHAAAMIAAKLSAEKLIVLTNVPGLLKDKKDESSLISAVRLDDLPGLIADGTVESGMIPKVDSCRMALEGGVKRAHIIDGRVPHSVLIELFSDEGIGTMITA
jgi:acetylglutamate kinase